MFPSRALLKRELLTSLRRTRILVWLLLSVLCCIGVIWISWPEVNTSPRMIAQSMTEILTGLGVVLLGCCILFVPSFAAGAIVGEREQDTLDLLRMSLVRGSGIVSAKVLNALGLFVLLMVAIAPAVGTTLFGVGLDASTIIYVFVSLSTVAITCALAGLASSAFFRRTIWAVVGAYSLTAIAFSLPYLFAGFVTLIVAIQMNRSEIAGQLLRVSNNSWFGSGSGQFIDIVQDGYLIGLASPVSAVWVILDRGAISGWWLLFPIFLQLLIWAIFAKLTMRWLHKRNPHAVVVNEELIDDLEILRSRREQFPYYLLDPLKRKKPIEDSRNPMLIREVRWGLFSRMTTLMRLCLAVFAMFFIASLFPVLYDNRETSAEIIVYWASVQYFVTMLFAPALVANSFTKEIELGNLDMIRMTLMRPRQILAGKAGAGVIVLSPVIIAVLFASIPLLFIGVSALPELVTSVITGLVWAGYCVAVSLTVSLFARRSLGALVASYGIVAFTYLILNPLAEFFWHRTALPNNRLYWERLGEEPIWLYGARLFNPTTAALSGSTFNTWCINTAVALVIIAICYGVASFVLTHHRMQDR